MARSNNFRYGAHTYSIASKNFYASFVAALEVELHAEQYFEKVIWSQPLPQVAWTLPDGLSWKGLLEAFGGDEEMARIFNPHVNLRARQGGLSLPRGSTVYLPEATYESFVQKASTRTSEATGTAGLDVYRVRPGETLSGIADRFGLSAHEIQQLNGIRDPSLLRAGQKLRLPEKNKRPRVEPLSGGEGNLFSREGILKR